MRSAAHRVAAALLAAASGLAAAQPPSDWEQAQKEKYWKESEVKLPAYPARGNLIGFEVSAGTDFKFFVDRASISVGKDGVVRYTVVARSPSGVDNVSYEGLHCRDGTHKVYAFGQPGGAWQWNPFARWRSDEPNTALRWHRVLGRDFFCPNKIPIASAADGISALRRGGNRAARGYVPDR